jgi:hypothetical protein
VIGSRLALVAVLLAGCTAVAPLRPDPVYTELEPLTWPRNAVKVQVEDRRPEREASPALVGAIEASIRHALAAPRAEACPCYTLTVIVRQHEGRFQGGGSGFWHGFTVLDATLADDGGRSLYHFRAEDHDEEWNVFGLSSGTTAAQQSLRDAIRKLVRQMAVRELPVAGAR